MSCGQGATHRPFPSIRPTPREPCGHRFDRARRPGRGFEPFDRFPPSASDDVPRLGRCSSSSRAALDGDSELGARNPVSPKDPDPARQVRGLEGVPSHPDADRPGAVEALSTAVCCLRPPPATTVTAMSQFLTLLSHSPGRRPVPRERASSGSSSDTGFRTWRRRMESRFPVEGATCRRTPRSPPLRRRPLTRFGSSPGSQK
jgi:hypothetical protein